MPSPFPGVDPYIEAEENWQGLHVRLATYIAAALNPLVRPRYFVDIERREQVVEENSRHDIGPDNVILRMSDHPLSATATALAESDTAVIVPRALEVPVKQRVVRIFDRKDGRKRVVTQIEILSPENKTRRGRDEYGVKQAELLASDVHLVEIDLLRKGLFTVAADEEQLRQRVPHWHFLVSVNRHPERTQDEVYPFTLRDRLPRVRIPLLAPDQDVILDLPAVYNRAYDEGPYRDLLDYSRDPPGFPLSPDERAWVAQHLRAQGLRGSSGNASGQSGLQ